MYALTNCLHRIECKLLSIPMCTSENTQMLSKTSCISSVHQYYCHTLKNSKLRRSSWNTLIYTVNGGVGDCEVYCIKKTKVDNQCMTFNVLFSIVPCRNSHFSLGKLNGICPFIREIWSHLSRSVSISPSPFSSAAKATSKARAYVR